VTKKPLITKMISGFDFMGSFFSWPASSLTIHQLNPYRGANDLWNISITHLGGSGS